MASLVMNPTELPTAVIGVTNGTKKKVKITQFSYFSTHLNAEKYSVEREIAHDAYMTRTSMILMKRS